MGFIFWKMGKTKSALAFKLRKRSEWRKRNQRQWSRSVGTEHSWPSKKKKKRGRSSRRITYLDFFLKHYPVPIKSMDRLPITSEGLTLAHGHLGGYASMPYWFLQFFLRGRCSISCWSIPEWRDSQHLLWMLWPLQAWHLEG